MKNNINNFLFFGFILLLGCSNSNPEKNPTDTATKKAATKNSNNNSSGSAQQGDGIVGDWKLALETYDDNGNKVLDDEERKKAFSNRYFYRFNPDGSCLINFTTNVKGAFKGHYTIKTENNKKKLTTIWDEAEEKGKVEGQYTIISVNKEELVLLESLGDHTFWIFKRA